MELRVHLDVEAVVVNMVDDESRAATEAEQRTYHGSTTPESLHDLPCFSAFAGPLRRVTAQLLFDKETQRLHCRVSLTLASELDSDRQRELCEVVRTKLWQSNWANNWEWPNKEIKLESDEWYSRVRTTGAALGVWSRPPSGQWSQLAV